MSLPFNPTAARMQALREKIMGRFRARRWGAYHDLFMDNGKPNVAADIVLADLRDFCRARETTFDADPRVHALLEGRREVWLRIANALGLKETDIAGLDPARADLLEEGETDG